MGNNNNKSEKINYNISGSKSDKQSGRVNTQVWETPKSDRNERRSSYGNN